MRNLLKAIQLIKQFEGCKLQAYLCPAGVPTIGWGSTGSDIYIGLTWTQQQCDDRLAQDVAKFAIGVEHLITVPVNDNQFCALVSFAYNLGLGNLKSSTLLKLLNSGDYDGAASEFKKWNRANNQVLAGLTRRRLAEETLFQEAI